MKRPSRATDPLREENLAWKRPLNGPPPVNSCLLRKQNPDLLITIPQGAAVSGGTTSMMDLLRSQDTIPWCGPAPTPDQVLFAWNFHPILVASLLALLIVGISRKKNRLTFFAAWIALVVGFVSPLCALTTVLFSARALHHLLLVSLAAPLFALSLPLGGWTLRLVSAPIALMLSAIALVMWHVPAIYSAAWDMSSMYWLMQFALLLPAWVFWSHAFSEAPRTAEGLLTVAALIGSLAGVMGLIGAALTFSNSVLYHEHLSLPLLWGIDPLSDQQTAGLIMWVPGLVPLALVAAIMARQAWRAGSQA